MSRKTECSFFLITKVHKTFIHLHMRYIFVLFFNSCLINAKGTFVARRIKKKIKIKKHKSSEAFMKAFNERITPKLGNVSSL